MSQTKTRPAKFKKRLQTAAGKITLLGIAVIFVLTASKSGSVETGRHLKFEKRQIRNKCSRDTCILDEML